MNAVITEIHSIGLVLRNVAFFINVSRWIIIAKQNDYERNKCENEDNDDEDEEVKPFDPSLIKYGLTTALVF